MACGCSIGSSGHVTIVQGSDRDLTLQILDSQGNPEDITGATDLKLLLPRSNGTLLELITPNVAILQAGAGTVSVTLSAANTALLKVDEIQTLELEYVISAKKSIVQFKEVLTVVARIA
jgi:hypothetical protein